MFKTKVVEIIDGDTFSINPGWQWNGQLGNRVRPTGYDAPERDKDPSGWLQAKEKLTRLILGKEVEIRDAHIVDRGRLVCDVYFSGRYLADYFPEYKSHSSALK